MKTLDVSIIGGEAETYYHPRFDKFRPGEFLWVKVEGEEHEKLVKVRGVNQRVSREIKRIESYRRAHKDRVLQVLKNMVRGLLWERGYENVKLARLSIDMDKGILKIDYVADKKLNLHVLGAEFAKILHVRVEFNQIGARDFAAEIGWLGVCGRVTCCKLFLKGKIPSVTIDMARKQYLFAGPEKLTGACGRLLCCLTYEFDFYEGIYSKVPRIGKKVKTPDGIGTVVELNVIKGFFRIRLESGEKKEIYFDRDKEWYVITEEPPKPAAANKGEEKEEEEDA